jgi:hypothetical protein
LSLLLLFNQDWPEVEELPSEVTGRLFMAWGNLADRATITGGNFRPGLPLSNLKIRRSSRVARSETADPSDTWFDVDLGASAIWRVFSLRGHNLSLDARYRLRASDDPTFASHDFDTGWVSVWPALFATEDLEWESDNWWAGTYTESQRQGLTWYINVRPPRFLASRYIRLEIDDPLNVSSYIQASRLFVANGWSPSRGMSFGASLAVIDPSEVQEAYSGSEAYSLKRRYLQAIFTLAALPESETYARAFELMREAGITGEVFFMWKDDDVEQAIRRQFIGRLEQLSAIDHPYPDHQSVGFKIKETL